MRSKTARAKATRALDILVICDVASRMPNNHDFSKDLSSPEWESEADVLRAMRALGHRPRLFPVYDEFDRLRGELSRSKTDLVFNLAEAWKGIRSHEPLLAGLFDLAGVPFTGASAESLMLCKDKAMAKKLVAYHGVRVPRFKAFPRKQVVDCTGWEHYPAIVKPLDLESSTGIAKSSFVQNPALLKRRVKFIHERLRSNAIAEEFIAGRELMVAVLITGRHLEIFPPRELFFGNSPSPEREFATFRAKWDDSYRAKMKIRSGPARSLSSGQIQVLHAACRAVVESLKLAGYVRIDFRLSPQGEPVFLEANPNPSIARDDDFAQSALQAGLGYEELIGEIVNSGRCRN